MRSQISEEIVAFDSTNESIEEKLQQQTSNPASQDLTNYLQIDLHQLLTPPEMAYIKNEIEKAKSSITVSHEDEKNLAKDLKNTSYNTVSYDDLIIFNAFLIRTENENVNIEKWISQLESAYCSFEKKIPQH